MTKRRGGGKRGKRKGSTPKLYTGIEKRGNETLPQQISSNLGTCSLKKGGIIVSKKQKGALRQECSSRRTYARHKLLVGGRDPLRNLRVGPRDEGFVWKKRSPKG